MAGIQTPCRTAADTTRRHACCDRSIRSLKNGSNSRFDSCGFASNASLIFAEKCRPDDAAAPPEKRDPAVVEIPLVFLRGLMQQHESLRIGNDLRCVQRLFEVAQKSLLVAGELSCRGRQHLDASTRSSFMADRHRAKTASLIRVSGMPRSSETTLVHFPVPFLSGGVEYFIDQRLSVGIFESKDVAGDLDQVAVEISRYSIF